MVLSWQETGTRLLVTRFLEALDREIPLEADASSSSEDFKSDNKFHVVRATSLFMASILVATGGTLLLYKRENNARSEDVVMQKQNIIYHEKKQQQFSQNLQTEVDVVGESSCPSEISSSFQKMHHLIKGSIQDESLYHLLHQSIRPLSYGSFKTYERIPIKNANGHFGVLRGFNYFKYAMASVVRVGTDEFFIDWDSIDESDDDYYFNSEEDDGTY